MAVDRSHSGREPISVWWQTEHSYDSDVLTALRRDPRFSVAVGGHVVDAVPSDPEALYFLAGDGSVIVPLCERLLSEGVPTEQLRTEFFFNKPPKKT